MALCVSFIISCGKKDTSGKLFKNLAQEHSNIGFSNNLSENDSINYFTYPYIYLGGGVSAGDINNDGLIDLYFTGNMVANKLYLNKGNLHFEDITTSAHVAGDSRWYTGTSMADVNNDGFLDIYCSVGGKFTTTKNQLFINNGDNTFTESAKAYNLDESGNSIQSTFFDYDMDGDLDVYIANYPPTDFGAPTSYYSFKMNYTKDIETDKLLRNNGDGTFTDVTNKSGLRSFGLTLSATTGDFNKDGWPDLYVSNDFSSPDFMYQNNKDGTFSDILQQATRQVSFFGMGVDIADINNDGLLDLLQVDMDAADNRRAKANMASMNPRLFWNNVNAGFHYQYMHNSLQLNNGVLNGSTPDFSNISRLSGISSTDWSWGPIIADFDNDGYKDVFITNGNRREINNKDYLNKLRTATNIKDSLLEKILEMPSEKIDNFVFRNKGDLTFEKANEKWGISYKGFSNGAVYADLDNDGDLEIVVNNIDDAASIFENKSSEINNAITLNFKGTEVNPLGIGVKVTLSLNGAHQYQEMTLTRGFQSSIAPKLHFGLKQNDIVDSIFIQWPDQKEQLLKEVKSNQFLTIDYRNSKPMKPLAKKQNRKLFVNEADSTLVRFKHVENLYNDFKDEILLPHETSKLGPCLAVGDLNGDHLDDIIIGSSAQNTTAIYFKTPMGFGKQDIADITKDSGSEDMGILIFDVENDGDNDIYIVSGGNEFEYDSTLLQDRLYINDGAGNFTKSVSALPKMITSGSRVKSYDFDNDGDLDLFVGGRLIPGNYPLPANSYLLENRSTKNEPKFMDVSSALAPDLNKLGMVTDAIWSDYNMDGLIDLIVVGEWMPITVLTNQKGKFINTTRKLELEDSNGWWFSINEGDFDKDGDMDYLLGNLGLNYKYKANEEETFDIYFNDFDGNNTNDIVLSYFNDGEKFPLRGRQCSSEQMPAIKLKFKDYNSFSTATLEDVYTEDYLEKSLHYGIKSFSSIFLENKKGTLVKHNLPNMAQLSNINQILVDDYDKDGNLDAVIAGNLFGAEVETPRNDAGIGLFLKGDGAGNFRPVPARESGLAIPGDVKDLAKITINEQAYIIAGKNGEYLEFVRVND
ncbi:MAG: VCBS repeat-containing protein [Saonia sp.]